MIEEKEDLEENKRIDVTANEFYTDIRLNSLDGNYIAIVSSMFGQFTYKTGYQDSLIAETYALGYAVKEIIQRDLDATIFVSKELYGRYLGLTIEQDTDAKLKICMDSVYDALLYHCKRYRHFSALGNLSVFLVKRVKVSITPSELMKKIWYQKFTKDFEFRSMPEYDRKLKK